MKILQRVLFVMTNICRLLCSVMFYVVQSAVETVPFNRKYISMKILIQLPWLVPGLFHLKTSLRRLFLNTCFFSVYLCIRHLLHFHCSSHQVHGRLYVEVPRLLKKAIPAIYRHHRNANYYRQLPTCLDYLPENYLYLHSLHYKPHSTLPTIYQQYWARAVFQRKPQVIEKLPV